MNRIKKLLSFVLVLALCLGIAPDLAVPAHAANSDFVIENGVLMKYTGTSPDVVVPDGVTDIDRNAFYGDEVKVKKDKLRSVVFPEGFTEVPGMCFYSFPALERVVLPQSLTSIGGAAFDSAASLKEINLPAGLKTIEGSAFSGCKSLTSITIPDSVTEIGAWAFARCTSLANVSLPSTASIGTGAFDGTPWLENQGSANNGLVIVGDTLVGNSFDYAARFDLVIPQGIRVIAGDAFSYLLNMTGATIPEGVEEIGTRAFEGCSKLTGLTLPSTVKLLGDHAFDSCKSLTEVTLPAGVTEVGNWAFNDCSNLKTVTVLGPDTVFKSEVFPLTATIRGWRGSDAERYANYYFMTFEPLDGPGQEEAGVKESPVAADPNAKAAESKNAGRQNYNSSFYFHADPIQSYLYQRQDGNFTRVECPEDSGYVAVEVYDRSFNLLTHREIPTELTIWGGFFAGEQYNFLIFGDSNGKEGTSEDWKKEVIRVVKYSKDWERLDSWSGLGMNTATPFDVASLRCAEKDGILTVRTGHEMFKTYDGMSHQANLAFSIRESDMTAVTCAGSSRFSYVSHSFNQFVLIEEDGVMATLDHGDGYPRAFVVNIHPDYRRTVDDFDITMGLSDAASVPLVYFPGRVGQNTTNAKAGGFEASSTHYLASVTLESGVDKNGNSVSDEGIMVYAVDKKTRAVTKYQVAAGQNLSNTQLVKLSGDRLLLLWEDRTNRSDTFYYTFLDGSGKPSGEVMTAWGHLSDCKPIPVDGGAVWYATGFDRKQIPVFYTIDAHGSFSARAADPGLLPSSWAMEQVHEATSLGLVPFNLAGHYTEPTSRAMFCGLADVLHSKTVPAWIIPTVTFDDCDDPAVARMAAIGVVAGVGGGLFDPDGELTREQAAAMLYRLADAAGKPFPAAAASFDDNGSIASWASKEVGAVQAAGIMSGVGDNRFDPKGSYTYEQSISTMLRMYHYLNQ